jgi:hypothetical protein
VTRKRKDQARKGRTRRSGRPAAPKARRATTAAPPARRRRPLAIDARAKTLALAAEPPVDREPAHLVAAFWTRLEQTLQDLASAGTPFRFVEGFRTAERQQWLYGSGRPDAPLGRPGPIVTFKDGIHALSNHQGNGAVGSGRAADCYPLKDGRVYIPKAADPVWEAYAGAAEARGLVAGYHWTSFKDAPHCELPPDPTEEGVPR